MDTTTLKTAGNPSWLGTAIAILTIAATVFGIGYAVGKDTNEGLSEFLKASNQAAEKDADRLRSEIAALQLELQKKNAVAPGVDLNETANIVVEGGVGTSRGAGGMAAGVSAPGEVSGTLSTSQRREEAIVRNGQTVMLFDGKISASLVGTAFNGKPLRYQAIMTFGATGKANLNMDKVDVGYATNFEGYEVRLLEADSTSVKVAVTRLEIE